MSVEWIIYLDEIAYLSDLMTLTTDRGRTVNQNSLFIESR